MWLVGDGFDYYGQDSDLARSVWDSYAAGGTATGTTPTLRFGTGRYFKTSSNMIDLTKNLASNEATIYAAFAYYRAGAGSGTSQAVFLTYYDGGTAQCTVVLEVGGNMTLKRGDLNGTVVATYAAAFSQDVWTHFQIRVVIDPTAGSITVRKNGQTSDTFTATGLNTRSTANSYANKIGVGGESTSSSIDDLFFFSGGGAAPNTWVGDVRCVTLAPSADTAQKQFATVGVPGSSVVGTGASPQAVTANTLHFTGPFVCARSGVLTKATVTLASVAMTGNAQVAIYAADAAVGLPGTLLGSSAVVTNGTASAALDFTFAAGPNLVQGRSYYVAYLADNSPAGGWLCTSSLAHYTQARTYAAGFPNPAGAVTGPSGSGVIATLASTGNVAAVSEAIANGDTDYVFDGTVGDADLYDMDDLQFTPQAIVGVVSKVYIKKSDAGTRQGQILVASGGTQYPGPDTVLGSTYTYFSRVDAVDPATGAAWTLAGLNAIKVGQKVTL